MARIIIQSSDWTKMLEAGWLGEDPCTADAELLLQKATEHAWNDCNMGFGECSHEFSHRTRYNHIIGFVEYVCVPEQEDLKDLIDEEKWSDLKNAADVLETHADEEQDTDTLIEEIEQAIEEYNARGVGNDND